MNVESIIENLVASLIFAVLAYLVKRIWKSLKSTKAEPEKTSSKLVLKRQFFISLFVFATSLIVFCSIGYEPIPDLLSMLKAFSGIVAALSFIITWGAFETAFAFYPEDDVVRKPPDQNAGSGRQ